MENDNTNSGITDSVESVDNPIDYSISVPQGVEEHEAYELEYVTVVQESDYDLASWGMVGIGSAAALLILSIGVATVLRILRASI